MRAAGPSKMKSPHPSEPAALPRAASLPHQTPRQPARRQVLAGLAVGSAALAGGAWLAWRHARPAEPAPGFWSLAFDTPAGTRLDLADWRGVPLILNFWATWCPPCVREMPMLAAAHAGLAARGIALVGIAVDGAMPVREFLVRQPAPYPIALAGFDGMALASRLGNERGGLPFTVAIGRDGRVAQRRLGEIHAPELQAWVESLAA